MYSQTVCYWQAYFAAQTTPILPPGVGITSAAPVSSQICYRSALLYQPEEVALFQLQSCPIEPCKYALRTSTICCR